MKADIFRRFIGVNPSKNGKVTPESGDFFTHHRCKCCQNIHSVSFPGLILLAYIAGINTATFCLRRCYDDAVTLGAFGNFGCIWMTLSC